MGKITTLVTGYQQLVRAYVMTCTNGGCPNYRQSLEGQICASCKRSLHSAEITKVVEEVQFEEPLQTQYQAPCVKVELNLPLVTAIKAQVDKIKESVRATHGSDIPEQFKDLWIALPNSLRFIACCIKLSKLCHL
jgi:DEAD/DEAH box helicase domain-containing protein